MIVEAFRSKRWLWGSLIAGGGVVCIALVGARNPVLSVALLWTLVWALIGTWSPRMGFFMFLGLLPFVDFLKRLQLAFTAPSALEWNLVLALPDVLLLGIATGVVLRGALAGRLGLRLSSTDWWLLVFWSSMLLSVVHSIFPLMIGLAAFKLSGFYVLVYFLAPSIIKTVKHLRLLLKITFMLALTIAFYGLWQLVFGMTAFEQKCLVGVYTGLSKETIMYYTFRPFSTLSGPQAYGYYLVIGFMCGLAYVRGFVPPKRRFLVYLGMFIIVLALALSLTRSAWIFFVLSWLIYRSGVRGQSLKIKHLVGVMILLGSFVFLLWYFADTIQAFVLRTSNPFVKRAFIVGTFLDRLRILSIALTDTRSWTVFGHGLGTTSSTLMAKFRLNSGFLSHSEYTNILIEQGLIGLISFSAFLVSWGRNSLRELQQIQNPSIKLAGQALFAIVVALLLVGWAGTNLAVAPINVYFWLAAGVLGRSSLLKTLPQASRGLENKLCITQGGAL